MPVLDVSLGECDEDSDDYLDDFTKQEVPITAQKNEVFH